MFNPIRLSSRLGFIVDYVANNVVMVGNFADFAAACSVECVDGVREQGQIVSEFVKPIGDQ